MSGDPRGKRTSPPGGRGEHSGRSIHQGPQLSQGPKHDNILSSPCHADDRPVPLRPMMCACPEQGHQGAQRSPTLIPIRGRTWRVKDGAALMRSAHVLAPTLHRLEHARFHIPYARARNCPFGSFHSWLQTSTVVPSFSFEDGCHFQTRLESTDTKRHRQSQHTSSLLSMSILRFLDTRIVLSEVERAPKTMTSKKTSVLDVHRAETETIHPPPPRSDATHGPR